MDSQSLEKASQYLNNLLLARGLLSNGKPIDFAHPKSDGQSTTATMARIINLVHDLVLRRDQDAEQREFLAASIRQARAEDNQRVLDLQRLQEKNADLSRESSTVEAQHRILKEAARKADNHAKELKEQMLKMKSTVDQVRAKCLSDVRKRDVELEKLKGHLASMQRGKKEGSGMRINTINTQPEVKNRERRTAQDVSSADWSLEKETSDFLAALVNETSTENVSLRKIITETMELLRDLTGLDAHGNIEQDSEDDGIGIPGQYRKSRQKATEAQDPSLISCVELADQMSLILRHCQTILRDPSFVPIEEVQIRDEEIIKLRAGWERMASRWKEAVTMMDAWRRRRRSENGLEDPIDELSNLEFGKSVATLPSGEPVFSADEEISHILYEQNELEVVKEEDEYSQNEVPEAVSDNSDLDIPPEPASKRRTTGSRRSGINGRPVRPLQPLDFNGQQSPQRIPLNDVSIIDDGDSGDSGIGGLDGHLDKENVDVKSKSQTRMPSQARQRTGPVPSVAERLAAVEAEALEAQALSQESTGQKRKQSRQGSRRTARRRSTLSPEELADLMGIE